MAFGKGEVKKVEVTKSLEDYFKPVSHQKVALRLFIAGRTNTGKTHISISAAEYLLKNHPCSMLYVIDTEGDYHINASTWPQEIQDIIQIFNAKIYSDNKIDGTDIVASIRELEKAIDILTSVIIENNKLEEPKHHIIVIDSASDMWEWLKSWVNKVAHKKQDKNGEEYIPRLEWGRANKKYDDFLEMLTIANCHVILTFRVVEEVDSSGVSTGKDRAQWQKWTDYKPNLVMETKRMESGDRLFYFKKSRFGDMPSNAPMINPTWEDIKNKVASYSSLEFV